MFLKNNFTNSSKIISSLLKLSIVFITQWGLGSKIKSFVQRQAIIYRAVFYLSQNFIISCKIQRLSQTLQLCSVIRGTYTKICQSRKITYQSHFLVRVNDRLFSPENNRIALFGERITFTRKVVESRSQNDLDKPLWSSQDLSCVPPCDLTEVDV